MKDVFREDSKINCQLFKLVSVPLLVKIEELWTNGEECDPGMNECANSVNPITRRMESGFRSGLSMIMG